MQIRVQFFSYYKDLTGCDQLELAVPANSSLAELHAELQRRFPGLVAVKKSTLLAVGLNYENGRYLLREGDEVSLFPPVQGG